MATQYQVMNSQTAKSFTAAESNENQRRWNDEKWQQANKDEKNNYDITRRHLNFEINANREIKPCGTSIGIDERIEQRFKDLGIRNPNEYWKNPCILVNKFVFSGSPETMRRLAFGWQRVDYSKDESVDNSQLERQKPIEDWALTIYDFMAKRYGKDNIVGFDVHLDESTPHAHVTIMPMTPEGKLSYKKVFGGNKWEVSKHLTKLHDDLYEEVSKNFGLERGEDNHVTNAMHKDKAEYYRELSRDIKTAEKRVKSLHTMIQNLLARGHELDIQILETRRALSKKEGKVEELEAKIAELQAERAKVDEQIADKEAKLKTATQQLTKEENKLENVQIRFKNAVSRMGNVYDITIDAALSGIYKAEIDNLYKSSESYNDYIWLQNHIKYPELYDARKSEEIFNLATRMFFKYVDGATTVAENTNGGGGGSDDEWWKRKDESDVAFARRCIMQSYARFYPMRFPSRRSGYRR